MRVAGEFSLIFESEVIKSRLVRDANAASISDYVLPSPPLPHSSFPFPPRVFFSPSCKHAFLFFLSLSRIWFTGFFPTRIPRSDPFRVFRKDSRGTIKIRKKVAAK